MARRDDETPLAAEALPESFPGAGYHGGGLERPRHLRPRGKLRRGGARALALEELLGLLLAPGAGDGAVPAGCLRLVRRLGPRRARGLSLEAWRTEAGLGPGAAARLAAAFELGRRAWDRRVASPPRISGPREAWRRVRHLGALKKEHLVGLYLDSQNGLAHQETISIGSLNTTRTHPREILFPAVEHLALGFILAHNHPSGCLEPSAEDLEFTLAVRRAGELLGIELYDHLIVARDGYTSLRERGAL
jgi:DNA repair protein RadC